jgi:lysophospholipase L1-like esterase
MGVAMSKLAVQDGQTFLFIGDSITDCGRRDVAAPYGNGYVSLAIELITGRWPERNIKYLNKGIGGNRVTDLQSRWHDDVIRHRPEWLSIKIGINDLHSQLGGAPDMNPTIFRDVYESILKAATKDFAPQIVLIDPFYLSTDTSGASFRSQVLELIPEYIAIVHDLAGKYGTRLVKTHDLFQRQLVYREPDVFCPEPVHPYRSGHLLIAEALVQALLE